jgi:hypothetical protein
VSKPEEGNPFRSPTAVVALVVVAAIILAAVVVGVVSVIGGSPSAQPSPSTSAAPGAPSDSDRSICGLTGFETTSSLVGPPTAKWELVGTVAAPTDPAGSGPGKVDSDGFRSCYAHTAQGALYFAVNLLAIGTDATIRDRMVELVEAGPGRDALKAAQEAAPAGSSGGTRAQVAGFSIGSYDASGATVDLALNTSTGTLISQPIKLVWADGDWKVVLTATGELPLAASPLQNLGGYIPWAGA